MSIEDKKKKSCKKKIAARNTFFVGLLIFFGRSEGGYSLGLRRFFSSPDCGLLKVHSVSSAPSKIKVTAAVYSPPWPVGDKLEVTSACTSSSKQASEISFGQALLENKLENQNSTPILRGGMSFLPEVQESNSDFPIYFQAKPARMIILRPIYSRMYTRM